MPRKTTPGRREFLRNGLACAAPLVLATPLAGSASRMLRASKPEQDDPLLDQLRREIVATHRAAQRGGIRGEHLRRQAAHVDLLLSYVRAKGTDIVIDTEIRRRARAFGRQTTAQDVMAIYPDLAASVKSQEGVALPSELDLTRTEAALDVVLAKGIYGAIYGHRKQLEWLASRVDRRSGLPSPVSIRPVAFVGQKPGDDFLGYPDEGEIEFSCGDLAILIDMIFLAAAVAAACGPEGVALATALAITGASLQLAKDIFCRGAS